MEEEDVRLILSLRGEGMSVDDIAKVLGVNKSTVSRRLKHMKELGYIDPYSIEANSKNERMKIGLLLEKVVSVILSLWHIDFEWLGREVGRYPDFELCDMKSVIEVKNLKTRKEDGNKTYYTAAESKKYVTSRFEGYDDEWLKVLIITDVKICPEARKLLKENNIKVITIGEQVRDLSLKTIYRVYFRLKRLFCWLFGNRSPITRMRECLKSHEKEMPLIVFSMFYDNGG